MPTETLFPIHEDREDHPDLKREIPTETLVPTKLLIEDHPDLISEIACEIVGMYPIQFFTVDQPLLIRLIA